MHNQDISALPEEKQGLIDLPPKPLSNRNPLNLPYQALGACFNPYNAFLNLYTQWGQFSLSNPDGCHTYTSSSNTPFKKLFTSIWCNLNPLATTKARRILIASKRAKGAKVSS
jgi:hypothetical protein